MPIHTSTSHSWFGRLFSLAWPVAGINVLTVLSLAVDTAMCGRLPNSELALTALGFATQVIFLLMVAMMGLVVGTVALIARARGAGDHDRVNHILLQSTMVTIMLAVAIALLGNIFAAPILRLLGASDAATTEGLRYLRPMLIGTVFHYLSVLYAALLRGLGDARIAFFVALGSNALNVVFNYFLILGNGGLPAWGVFGAAVGTVASQALGVFALVSLLRRGVVPGLKLPLRPRKIDRDLAKQLFKVGAPAALDMVILNASFISIVGMLGRLNEIAVAAHGIGLRIQALAFVPGMSISQATGALIGQALGAGDVDAARRIVRASILLCTMVMTTLAVVIIATVGPMLALFSVAPDTPLANYSQQWIELLGYGMPIVGLYVAYTGMLRGSGATTTSLWINILVTLGFQIPLSYVLGLALDWGPFGVWIAFPVSYALRAALGHWAYRRGHWAKVGLEAMG